MRLISVDLPTLGNPTRATSASSLSSRRSQRSSPSSPCSLNDSSDATLWSATSHTSPPEPPSPPSGPPLATCASRRNATEPAPPSPALACRLHSSTNWANDSEYDGGAGRVRTRAAEQTDDRRAPGTVLHTQSEPRTHERDHGHRLDRRHRGGAPRPWRERVRDGLRRRTARRARRRGGQRGGPGARHRG